MPIKPENRARYPKDWRGIRLAILVRAGHRCEGSPDFPDCRASNGHHKSAGDIEAGGLANTGEAVFGKPAGPAPSGEPISSVDLVNLETLLSDAGVVPQDVKAQFGVLRLAALTVPQWDDVVRWVIARAAERGIVLQPVAHSPEAPLDETPSALDVARGITERIGNGRGGLFAEASSDSSFADLKSDLPWEDHPT